MNAPLWVAIPTVTLAAVAAWADVRTRRIPNGLTLPALLVACIARFALGGAHGLLGALEGAGLLLALLLPGWLAGWMGAGDVKLLAAIGAWLGLPHAMIALLMTLIAGGVLAAIVAARRRELTRSLKGAAALAGSVVMTGANTQRPAPTGARFPFAVAALAGTVAALMLPIGSWS